MANLAVTLAVIFSLLFVLSHARFLVTPGSELTSKHSPEDFAADLLTPNTFGSIGEFRPADRRPHHHMMHHRYWHHRFPHCRHHGRREISYGNDVILNGKPVEDADQIYVVEDRVEKREEGGWMGKVRKFLDTTFAL